MASLSENLSALATRVGTECKTLHDTCTTIQASVGSLSSLTTTDKTSLVAALNALQSALGSVIDDTTASTTTTYSSTKIANEILTATTTLKNELLNGAGEAYDTLKELADLIQDNQSAIDALESLAAGHVKYDGAQTLTDAQQTQARSNIGAAAAADLATLTTNVGDTTTNFVTAFETALNGTDVSNELDEHNGTDVSNKLDEHSGITN